MGYDIRITKQKDWFDEDETKHISLQEWVGFIADDADMRLDKYAEAVFPNGEGLIFENEGLGVWTKYSGHGLNGNYAWLYYDTGAIVCKNPDDEIIGKMLDIAVGFNAQVQGDDGEIYGRLSNNKVYYKHQN
jgi:hypothetical protein